MSFQVMPFFTYTVKQSKIEVRFISRNWIGKAKVAKEEDFSQCLCDIHTKSTSKLS